MTRHADGSETDRPREGVPHRGRLRAGLRSAGTALRTALYGNEPPPSWGIGSDGGRRRYIVRLMPVLAAALALFAVVNRPDEVDQDDAPLGGNAVDLGESQSSSTPVKWCRNTTGIPVVGPTSR